MHPRSLAMLRAEHEQRTRRQHVVQQALAGQPKVFEPNNIQPIAGTEETEKPKTDQKVEAKSDLEPEKELKAVFTPKPGLEAKGEPAVLPKPDVNSQPSPASKPEATLKLGKVEVPEVDRQKVAPSAPGGDRANANPSIGIDAGHHVDARKEPRARDPGHGNQQDKPANCESRDKEPVAGKPATAHSAEEQSKDSVLGRSDILGVPNRGDI